MGKMEPPICPSCNTNITVKHITIQYPLSNFRRGQKECYIPENLYEALLEPYSDTEKKMNLKNNLVKKLKCSTYYNPNPNVNTFICINHKLITLLLMLNKEYDTPI